MKPNDNIMITCPCNVDHLTTHLYSKSGVYRGIHYFLIFALKHILWVLVKTAFIALDQLGGRGGGRDGLAVECIMLTRRSNLDPIEAVYIVYIRSVYSISTSVFRSNSERSNETPTGTSHLNLHHYTYI